MGTFGFECQKRYQAVFEKIALTFAKIFHFLNMAAGS
jgi:hypothetical protein